MAASQPTKPSAYIIGAGPGIGTALATLFASKGFEIGLLARSSTTLLAASSQPIFQGPDAVNVVTTQADAFKPETLPLALDDLKKQLGHEGPTVVVYNVGSYDPNPKAELGPKPLEDLTVDALEKHLRAAVCSALVVGQWATKNMVQGERKRALFYTGGGAAFTHYDGFEALSIAKAGERAINKSFHNVLKPKGIHCSEVVVCGHVSKDDPKYNPKMIADIYWELYEQKEGEWEEEIIY